MNSSSKIICMITAVLIGCIMCSCSSKETTTLSSNDDTTHNDNFIKVYNSETDTSSITDNKESSDKSNEENDDSFIPAESIPTMENFNESNADEEINRKLNFIKDIVNSRIAELKNANSDILKTYKEENGHTIIIPDQQDGLFDYEVMIKIASYQIGTVKIELKLKDNNSIEKLIIESDNKKAQYTS